MAKIKRLIIEDFGGIVGRHKIDFLRKRKKLTIIRGDMAYGFATNGPFHLSTLISAAIKNALGMNITKQSFFNFHLGNLGGIDKFPEDRFKNAKSSIELDGEPIEITEENEFLYFFQQEELYAEVGEQGEYGHDNTIVSSSKIPKKFLTKEVVDEMNNYVEKILLFERRKIKFRLEDDVIQIYERGDVRTFEKKPSSNNFFMREEEELGLNFLNYIAFIIFLALRKVHLPPDSFAVIHVKDTQNVIKTLFTILRMAFLHCSQVIYLTDSGKGSHQGEIEKIMPEFQLSEKITGIPTRVYEINRIDSQGNIVEWHKMDSELDEPTRRREPSAIISEKGIRYPIYLDYHSTTYVEPDVSSAMEPYFSADFGNASSIDHSFGYDASVAVQTSRETIAKAIGCKMDEIIFTSGATESDNLALIGVMEKNKDKGNHLITCTTEHKAILDTARYLETKGFDVTYLPVDQYGQINLEELKNAITDKTVMISIMAANNEIGTIAELEEIGKIAHEKNVYFHTDAAQAIGHIPIDVEKMHIDLMSFSSHKIYGPKGIGALYVRSTNPRVKLDSIIHGGGQERNIRSGTLNVPGIIGFAKAVEIIIEEMESKNSEYKKMIDKMFEKLEKVGAKLNGHPEKRLAHNLNVRFEGIESKAIINSVSKKFAISAGSACTTEVVEPSHVLLAIGLSEEQSHSSIRIGIGRKTKPRETQLAADEICEAVELLGKIKA